MQKQYVLVRTDKAGVYVGTLESEIATKVKLSNARMIWNWNGAFTILSIANNGVGKGSRIPAPVPYVDLLGVNSVLPCSDKAKKNLVNYPVHKP